MYLLHLEHVIARNDSEILLTGDMKTRRYVEKLRRTYTTTYRDFLDKWEPVPERTYRDQFVQPVTALDRRPKQRAKKPRSGS